MSFIKIHRDLMDSYAFANPKHLKIWLWLLMKANYKKAFIPISTGRGEMTVEVKRGQLIFGRFKAEEELCMDGNFIYRTLQKFQELDQINIKSDSHYSIITICKYDSYQSKDNENEQALNNQRTTNEQHVNNTRTTHEQHVNTYKEELEEIEEKECKEERYITQSEILKNSNLFRQPNIPTYDQVFEYFIKNGGTEEMAKNFFNKHEGAGWFVNGSPISNFVYLANNFINNWNTNLKSKSNGTKSRAERHSEGLKYLLKRGEEEYAKVMAINQQNKANESIIRKDTGA